MEDAAQQRRDWSTELTGTNIIDLGTVHKRASGGLNVPEQQHAAPTNSEDREAEVELEGG